MSAVEVLISAMHQNDLSLADSTEVNSDVLIINQCNTNQVIEENREFGKIRCISTTERGLSRSRNMALENATGKYCLICDDDERLSPGYSKIIEDTYKQIPQADLICFDIKMKGKKCIQKVTRINYLTALKISSVQISFKRESILKACVWFDVNFGSGTPLGSGEENIFLYECLKEGLKIYYVPVTVAEVLSDDSRWFKGYTQDYFLHRGTISRKLMGRWLGLLYCIYSTVRKHKAYSENMSPLKALKFMIDGLKVKM